MKTQHELFDEWNIVCDRLKRLSSVIQNDFNSGIQDGYLTLDSIANDTLCLIGRYDTEVKELNRLRLEIINFLGEKVREHSNQGVMK